MRPEDQSISHERMKLKKESIREEHEKSIMADTELLDVYQDRTYSRVAFNETPNIAPYRGEGVLKITEN